MKPANSDHVGGVPPPRENPLPGEGTRPTPPAPADDPPGLPFFRTWRGVYWFVFACFVLVVVALALFSRHYA